MKKIIFVLVLTTSSVVLAGGSDVGSADDQLFSNAFIPLATCKISADSEKEVTASRSNISGQFTIIADLGRILSSTPVPAIVVKSDSQVGDIRDKSLRVLKTGVGSAALGTLEGYKELSKKATFVSNTVIYNEKYQWKEVITFTLKDGKFISARWDSVLKNGQSNSILKFHCQ